MQPSPTLRWHPWAPIVVVVLAVGFIFLLGIRLGYWLGRMPEGEHVIGRAFNAKLHIQDQISGDARSLVNDALLIDSAVQQVAREMDNPPSFFEERARAVVERIRYPWSKRTREEMRKAEASFVRSLAEFRLASAAAGAPLWQRTAGDCKRYGETLSGVNVTAHYQAIADAYSKVLGRRITAAQLAPAVPGGFCPGKEVK